MLRYIIPVRRCCSALICSIICLSLFQLTTVCSQNANLHNFGVTNAALEYDRDLLDAEVHKRPHFVMFYAPWCGHCQRLSATFDKLAVKYNKEMNREKVVISKVDCTKHTELCSDHNVLGYPTLVYFWSRTSFAKKYKGSRDFDSLDKYINEMISSEPPVTEGDGLNVPSSSRSSEKKALYELTDETFEGHIASGQHFVKFFAPWCSHCQTLAPTWDQLAVSFEHDTEVTIAKVDCTQHNKICAKHSIQGYPTLIYFNRGLQMDQYNGPRDLNSLVEFVTLMKAKAATSSAASAHSDGVPPSSSSSSDTGAVHSDTEEDALPAESAEPAGTTEEQELAYVSGEVKSLTVATFDKFTSTNQLHFVLYYVDWCPHCQAVKPIWHQLAKEAADQQITFSRINCVDDNSLCVAAHIQGYPTILAYQDGKQVGKYNGIRQIDRLKAFVEQLKDSLLEEAGGDDEPKIPVVDLSEQTFQSALSSETYTFVSFIQPWCIHCKDLKVVWESLGQSFSEEDWITIARVDCSVEEKLCQTNGITKFPTMILYRNGDRVAEYTGTRDLQSLRRFAEDSRLLHDEL